MTLRFLWCQRHHRQLYRLSPLPCTTSRQPKLAEPVVVHMLRDPAPRTQFLDGQPALLSPLHQSTPLLQLELPLYFTDLHSTHLTYISLKNWNSSFSKWELLCHKSGDGARVPVIECLLTVSETALLYAVRLMFALILSLDFFAALNPNCNRNEKRAENKTR